MFGRKTGYNIVYKEVLDRGARIIVLHENEKVFDTYVVDTLGVHLPYTHDRSEKIPELIPLSLAVLLLRENKVQYYRKYEDHSHAVLCEDCTYDLREDVEHGAGLCEAEADAE